MRCVCQIVVPSSFSWLDRVIVAQTSGVAAFSALCDFRRMEDAVGASARPAGRLRQPLGGDPPGLDDPRLIALEGVPAAGSDRGAPTGARIRRLSRIRCSPAPSSFRPRMPRPASSGPALHTPGSRANGPYRPSGAAPRTSRRTSCTGTRRSASSSSAASTRPGCGSRPEVTRLRTRRSTPPSSGSRPGRERCRPRSAAGPRSGPRSRRRRSRSGW